jgi:hypothetical protein
VFRRHDLKGAGHLNLVMANTVAGLAGKYPTVQAIKQRIELPVFGEKHPACLAQQILLSKNVIRLEQRRHV